MATGRQCPAVDRKKVAEAVRLFLEAIGEDPERPGLRETPDRVARMCEELFAGYRTTPAEVLRVISPEDHDEMVLVKNIPFYSVCEHHLLPFHGLAHVAYIPQDGRMTGLSKLARVVELEAKKLRVQETLGTAIAEDIVRVLQPRGVIVVLEAEHLCMTMRGVGKPGSVTVTSVVRGLFRENPATRSEVLALIKGKG
jgi:GTP cyclohydrolase I